MNTGSRDIRHLIPLLNPGTGVQDLDALKTWYEAVADGLRTRLAGDASYTLDSTGPDTPDRFRFVLTTPAAAPGAVAPGKTGPRDLARSSWPSRAPRRA